MIALCACNLICLPEFKTNLSKIGLQIAEKLLFKTVYIKVLTYILFWASHVMILGNGSRNGRGNGKSNGMGNGVGVMVVVMFTLK